MATGMRRLTVPMPDDLMCEIERRQQATGEYYTDIVRNLVRAGINAEKGDTETPQDE